MSRLTAAFAPSQVNSRNAAIGRMYARSSARSARGWRFDSYAITGPPPPSDMARVIRCDRKTVYPRGKITAMRVGLLCVACAIVCGCASGGGGGAQVPDYNVIRLYNESPSQIYDVELNAGGTSTLLDKLPP